MDDRPEATSGAITIISENTIIMAMAMNTPAAELSTLSKNFFISFVLLYILQIYAFIFLFPAA